mmetsp:Transcript_19245/g.73653  ORF Transcript_19245/g.73653 Transcript_19245/m.73653 type:complete len:540 (-) Transcript_19245:5059-6678(-)
MLSCCWEICRSGSLKSYGMFHPSGPKRLRSRTMAWKKQRPNSSFLNARGFRLQPSNHSGSAASRLKLPMSEARIPLGGSMVILTPFWSTETGNLGLGMAVSHSRKFGDVVSGSSSSHSRSSVGIHDSARWQFCRQTHTPVSTPSERKDSAVGPCPWPRDTWRMPLSRPSRSARASSSDMGSAPADRTKMSGLVLAESSKHFLRSKAGGSMKRLPSSASTKTCTACTTLSGRRQRSRHMRWNSPMAGLDAKSSPRLVHGSASSKTASNAGSSASTRSSSALPNTGSSERADRSAHILGESHSRACPALGLGRATSIVVDPCRKALSSAESRRSASRLVRILKQRSMEKRSLSFSKSERQTFSYSTKVNVSLSDWTTAFMSVESVSALSMARRKRSVNHSREYWYMGSTLARSAMQKNRMDARLATGRYLARRSLILAWYLAAARTASMMVLDVFLDSSRALMRASSSRMSSPASASILRILFSMALSWRWFSASSSTSSSRLASSAASRRFTVMPSIWSRRPSSVAMKLRRFTLTTVSGG